MSETQSEQVEALLRRMGDLQPLERIAELEAELDQAREREQLVYAHVLNALDPNRGGYTSSSLTLLRRFVRERSGLSDEDAAALAAQPESIIEVPPGRFEADEVLEELKPESSPQEKP